MTDQLPEVPAVEAEPVDPVETLEVEAEPVNEVVEVVKEEPADLSDKILLDVSEVKNVVWIEGDQTLMLDDYMGRPGIFILRPVNL